jgi:virginiamycin B lyase
LLLHVDPDPGDPRFNLPDTTKRRLDIAGDGMIWYVNSALGRLGLDQDGSIRTGLRRAANRILTPSLSSTASFGTMNRQRPDTLVRFDPASEKFQSWPIPSGNLYGGILRHMRPTATAIC